ncbi:DUF4114 domain-containing protein [Azorhizobium caulinodans]|uniref:DUF4114 domain-containing protein n=1 Tax=Azorhizobium caulinodans TaxID=7 RepID=UPI002FBE4F06
MVANSSYLDFTSYGTIPASVTDPATAYGLTNTQPVTGNAHITVAVVLNRANDPTALLNADWGTRQATLAQMQANGTLWTTYGADTGTFNNVKTQLGGIGTVLGDETGTGGYVTSAASRTIWVSLDAAGFQTLFGTPLMKGAAFGGAYEQLYWNGDLSLPASIASSTAGLWFDYGMDPATSALTSSTVALPQGAQSPGNQSTSATELYPQDIATLYNFPLSGPAHRTGTLALVEIGIGDALNPTIPGPSFQSRLQAYLATAGVPGSGAYYVQNSANERYNADNADERSLDVGVVSAIVPNSLIGLYVGSGDTVYTAYQTAIWDQQNNPAVISSSWSDGLSFAPGSPFATAYRELFVDAALRGISVFNDAFDGGSGNETGTGLTNLFTGSMSSYAMVVGGTSVSTLAAAQTDSTLAGVVLAAQQGDLATLWQLVRGGLTAWPAGAGQLEPFIETVWNQYVLSGSRLFPGYGENFATSGGVDTTQATPGYQTAFGLTPTDADPSHGTGRGAPDVSALSQGNMGYLLPGSNMLGVYPNGGTSAATPFWAALATEFNAIFKDQGLPNLGYSNDLYYIAAAIAPASFNDITAGNNVSTFIPGSTYTSPQLGGISATGLGYAAGQGYDLTTGLGSPNGLLLARALSSIAHAELYYDLTPVLENAGAPSSGASAGWSSTADQSLLFQSSLSHAGEWSLSLGSATYSFAGNAASPYAWTSALAQQSLQSDFSPTLVTLFDGYGQGQIIQTGVAAGTPLALSVSGTPATSHQATLTADYGFVDFVSGDGLSSVEVARPLAVATTANGANDADAVVRLRQNGVNDVSVMFYKVADYAGTVDGLAPGQAGYAEAAAAHAYSTINGQTTVSGTGYGAYSQTELAHVNAGDLIAMKLTSNGETYWAFASGNETVNGQHVAHLWSYGLNTWGWEDLYGGGDHDYNDLIVQLDFTSASGSHLLV